MLPDAASVGAVELAFEEQGVMGATKARANRLAMESGIVGEAFNIFNHTPMS